MNEVWKTITGYEGIYEVSSFGNVRRTKSLQPLKPQVNRYPIARLYKDGNARTFYIHCLVAAAFLNVSPCCPACGTQLEIHHKDGIIFNNGVENLEYVSRKDNMRLAQKKIQRGCRKKLSEADVESIRLQIADGKLPHIEIANSFGISKSMICDIHKGRAWKSF